MATRRFAPQLSRSAIAGATPRLCLRQRSLTRQTCEAMGTARPTLIRSHGLRQEQKRWHTTPSDLKPGKQYDFAGMKKITESPNQEIIVIDVREPSEYEAGYIPNAFNVPISSSPDAFHLTPEDFFDRFGFTKPGLDKEVVVYCKAGVRSRAAAQLARQNGYEKVGEYPGSWLDWQKNGGGDSKNPAGGVEGNMKI